MMTLHPSPIDTLRLAYLEMINHRLPKLAKSRDFPVNRNHCFGRIILDALFGRCWYEVLDRKLRIPAYKQLTVDQLRQALTIGHHMAMQSDSYIQALNRASLECRGK